MGIEKVLRRALEGIPDADSESAKMVKAWKCLANKEYEQTWVFLTEVIEELMPKYSVRVLEAAIVGAGEAALIIHSQAVS